MLLAIAEAVTDDAERLFLAGFGNSERVSKGGRDFATTTDLKIEVMLRQQLTSLTGIPVYGEEGGGSLDDPAVWVVDPVDGTSNYAAGNPNCAILISLLMAGQPIVALCSMPTFGKRVTAYEGSALFINGAPQPVLDEPDPELVQVGFGSLIAGRDHTFRSTLRHRLLTKLAEDYTRLRVTGSVGIDLAYTAMGIFSAAVTFSPFPWDNAAGVLLVQAAGGTVTDLDGKPWTVAAKGVVAGTATKHAAILSTIDKIR